MLSFELYLIAKKFISTEEGHSFYGASKPLRLPEFDYLDYIKDIICAWKHLVNRVMCKITFLEFGLYFPIGKLYCAF